MKKKFKLVKNSKGYYPVINPTKIDKKDRKNLFFKKNSILLTGNAEKVNKISRNLYRKKTQIYKFSP